MAARFSPAALLLAALPPAVPASKPATPARLPVGDGRISDGPRKGYVFACPRGWFAPRFGAPGARATGGWFHGDTWNPLEKPHVQGHVLWPQARFGTAREQELLRLRGNGLPVGTPTGRFPITPDDPAWRYDTNPNAIRAQQIDLAIPLDPQPAPRPGCLPMGMIGVSLSGVPFYNALDEAGRDAAAHEIQDKCDGHPQQQGQYHYHSGSACLAGRESNSVVGWALDGYPILGTRDASGRVLWSADLDACHGRAETVVAAGRRYRYAYRLTPDYPYVLGCFAGQLPRGR
ncbi:MAG: hypothetical protein A4S16_03845 [Proteobacteria bacterium SG_bin6]|nr:MAG: hypothetical protein A4S16_03845 [Proteobacteria bacterium SG_bin6]